MADRKRQAAASPKPDPLDFDESDETTPGTTPPASPEGTPDSVTSINVTVGDVATKLGDLPCTSSDGLLRDVAHMLLSTGQMVTVVLGERGLPQGLITERDILRCYNHSPPWDITVAEWMRRGGGVSLSAGPTSSQSAQSLNFTGMSVPPEQPLQEAMGMLLSPSSAPNKDCPGAGSSFLLVQRNSQGYGGGVLSRLELARAMAGSGLQLGPTGTGGMETPATVADIMQPLEDARALVPGFTMQHLLHELLSLPSRAVLVSDVGGVRGFATVSDALWLFHQQLPRDVDAWERLVTRPGRMGLEGHRIPTDASLQQAANAMMSRPAHDEATPRGSLDLLVAIEPGTSNVVGVVSLSDLTGGRNASRSIPVLLGKQDVVQPQPCIPKRLRHHKKRRIATPHQVTVADIVSQRETATCVSSEALVDAADALVASGRTAAVVVNAMGDVQGVLTENDLLAALVDGTLWDCKIETWLRSGHARLPGFLVPALTISPSTMLAEAAAEMTAQLEDGSVGTGFACHHLLVRSGRQGSSEQVRLLSALDVARGMIDAVAAQAAGARGGIEGDAVFETSDMTVQQAMKDRSVIASCKLTDTLEQAFEIMFESGQNCAIVVSGSGADESRRVGAPAEGRRQDPDLGRSAAGLAGDDEEQTGYGLVQGVITAADALRAFSERQRGQRTTVAGWLRGLTAAEHRTAARRIIRADDNLSDAALAMGVSEVHHLVVLERSSEEVVGVLSALDIVSALSACYRFDLATPRGG